MQTMGERLTKKEQKQRLREQGCVNCGQPYGQTDRDRRIELDHFIAWGDLPENQRDDIDQLQPMCGRCNRYKNKYTYEQINLRQIPNWPRDFDWERLAWVDWRYTPEDQARLAELRDIDNGDEDPPELVEEYAQMRARRIPSFTPALWIHGEHFDVPIWPSDRATTDVEVHDLPQFAQESLGREK